MFPILLILMDIYPLQRVRWTVEGKEMERKLASLTLTVCSWEYLSRRKSGFGERQKNQARRKITTACYGITFFLWKSILPRAGRLLPNAQPIRVALLSALHLPIGIIWQSPVFSFLAPFSRGTGLGGLHRLPTSEPWLVQLQQFPSPAIATAMQPRWDGAGPHRCRAWPAFSGALARNCHRLLPHDGIHLNCPCSS